MGFSKGLDWMGFGVYRDYWELRVTYLVWGVEVTGVTGVTGVWGFEAQGSGFRMQDSGEISGLWRTRLGMRAHRAAPCTFQVSGFGDQEEGGLVFRGYRGTSLMRNTPLRAPYSRTTPRVQWWS